MKYSVGTKRILTISDMHIPYHNKNAFAFLKALKAKYKPDLVVNMGDLADFHGISFHDSDPDEMSSGWELTALRKYSAELEKIFPKMIIIGSNHGDLPLRKAFAHGLPSDMIRPYNEIYGVGKGWQFCDDLMLEDGQKLYYFNHGIKKDGIKLAAQRGVCQISGHFHEDFRIDYISNPRDLLWSMQTGCLIDPKARAFKYNKLNINRPIIGTGLIITGQPLLVPMILDAKGDWNRKLAP